jgi:hypothetical protein
MDLLTMEVNVDPVEFVEALFARLGEPVHQQLHARPGPFCNNKHAKLKIRQQTEFENYSAKPFRVFKFNAQQIILICDKLKNSR